MENQDDRDDEENDGEHCGNRNFFIEMVQVDMDKDYYLCFGGR